MVSASYLTKIWREMEILTGINVLLRTEGEQHVNCARSGDNLRITGGVLRCRAICGWTIFVMRLTMALGIRDGRAGLSDFA